MELSDWLKNNRSNTEFRDRGLLISAQHRRMNDYIVQWKKAGAMSYRNSATFPPLGLRCPHTGGRIIFDMAGHYCSLNHGPRSFVDRAAGLHSPLLRMQRSDGVIQWLIEEEETLVWDVPAQ